MLGASNASPRFLSGHVVVKILCRQLVQEIESFLETI